MGPGGRFARRLRATCPAPPVEFMPIAVSATWDEQLHLYPKGSRTGYLKAIRPDFLECILGVWPAPGARESLQKCGGRSQTSKLHPTNPARLPSGTQPKWFLGHVFFWRPGAPRPRNHTVSGNECFFGPAAFGGKANKQLYS